MKLEPSLKRKVNQRIDAFIKEMKPKDGSQFTYSQLYPIYQEKLKEYSTLVYDDINEGFIEEQLTLLNENIHPVVREATDGTDVILTSILDIEVAKIIYEDEIGEEKSSINSDDNNIDNGLVALNRAMTYLYSMENDQPSNKVTNALSQYIYRNKKSGINQNSGCAVVLIIVTGLASTLISIGVLFL